MTTTGRNLLATAEGTSDHPFAPLDWGLLTVATVIWGASFLFIAIGLDALAPGAVTWFRLLFGFLALAVFPRARRADIPRSEWPRFALLGLVWMAVPMTMFPLAEQWISSSVAGMLNGALPIFSAIVASILLRRPPGRAQLAGLAVGLAGVVAISLPSLRGGSHTALGAALIVAAMVCYGLSTNLVVPLQQEHGSLPVIWRSQAAALIATTPFGIVGLAHSTFTLEAMAAVLALGALGTGVAFVAAGALLGRVGATRGSVVAYLMPVVALVLGVVVRDEAVAAISLVGMVLVLVGAWLVSRAGR